MLIWSFSTGGDFFKSFNIFIFVLISFDTYYYIIFCIYYYESKFKLKKYGKKSIRNVI